MKKIMMTALAAGMLLTFSGCAESGGSGGSSTAVTSAAVVDITPGNAQDDFQVKTNSDGVEFKVNHMFVLKENAWMGLVPRGAQYASAAEADENDVYYSHYSNDQRGEKDDYRFYFDPNCIGDGEYSMVLCSSEDEDGKVLVQFDVTKSGGDITPEFSTAKYHLE